MTPLEKYAENFVALNYLIRSESCPGNVYQIANLFHQEHKEIKDNSLDAFALNGRHYYPQDSFIKKVSYSQKNKQGQLVFHYNTSASFLGELLEQQDIKTFYNMELSVRVKKIIPLQINKDQLIVDILFDHKNQEILFMSRDKDENIQSDIVPYHDYELGILRTFTNNKYF